MTTAGEVTLEARRQGKPRNATVRFSVPPRGKARIEAQLDDGFQAAGEGVDLFDALVALRRQLEEQGIDIATNGARRDVYPSAMLRQTSEGRWAYVLTQPPTGERQPTVDIFGPARWDQLATVDEQRRYFEEWAGRPPAEGEPLKPVMHGGPGTTRYAAGTAQGMGGFIPPSVRSTPPPALVEEARKQPGGWVYEVVGNYGPNDRVPPEAIRGAWKVDERGNIVGEMLPNPNFRDPRSGGGDQKPAGAPGG